MELPIIPEYRKAELWLRHFLEIVQKQAEEIATLKSTFQELKYDIPRLNKTPIRPKFRPGGNPRDKNRYSKSGESCEKSSQKAKKPRVKEEVVLQSISLPEGSRFKGYSEYSI